VAPRTLSCELIKKPEMNINLVQANHGFGESGGGDVEEVPQGLKPAVILHHFRHD